MMFYRNMKVKVRSSDVDTDIFDFVTVLQGNTFAPYLLIICLDYFLQTPIDLNKENAFMLKKGKKQTTS